MSRMDEKNGYRGWDLWQSDRAVSVHIVDKWSDNAIKVTTRDAVLKPGEWQHVFMTYNGSGKANGIQIYINGVLQKRLIVNTNTIKPKASIRTTVPMKIGQRSDGAVFADGSVQDVRLYDRQLSEAEIRTLADVGPLRAILAAATDKRTPQQRNALFAHYLATRDTEWMKHDGNAKKLEAEKDAIKARSPITHVQEEVMNVMPMANILARGAYDKPGDRVEAAVPAALGKLPEKAPKNRLGLAQWLVSPENALTARVTVNRFWQELFGQGIVKTPEDFGIMGAAPSHPEMLDWLAVEFRESGWDVKKLVKTMVLSATYRQSSRVTKEIHARDPHNRLFARAPRYRLDAEQLRDQALFVSGLLVEKVGGPSVKPPQPRGLWEAVAYTSSNTAKFFPDLTHEKVHRRSLYTFIKRTAPPPQLSTFDAPSREQCVVRRERTNTPLQALLVMNEAQYVEAARVLAQRGLHKGGGSDETRIRYLFQLVTGRAPDAEEILIVQGALADHRAHFTADTKAAEALIRVGVLPPDATVPASELAAWTMIGNLMLNLDEVLTKN